MSLPPVIVVGELNPYGADPRYALFDEPLNSAGANLRRRVFGLRRTHYHRYTKRFNLCTGVWDASWAQIKATEILHAGWLAREEGRTYVLLGRKVATAFGVGMHPAFSVVKVDDRNGCLWPCILLPHPSGRNRVWNEPGSFDRARKLLQEVRPDIPWGENTSPPVVTTPCTNCGLQTTDNVCPDCGFDQGGGNWREA